MSEKCSSAEAVCLKEHFAAILSERDKVHAAKEEAGRKAIELAEKSAEAKMTELRGDIALLQNDVASLKASQNKALGISIAVSFGVSLLGVAAVVAALWVHK